MANQNKPSHYWSIKKNLCTTGQSKQTAVFCSTYSTKRHDIGAIWSGPLSTTRNKPFILLANLNKPALLYSMHCTTRHNIGSIRNGMLLANQNKPAVLQFFCSTDHWDHVRLLQRLLPSATQVWNFLDFSQVHCSAWQLLPASAPPLTLVYYPLLLNLLSTREYITSHSFIHQHINKQIANCIMYWPISEEALLNSSEYAIIVEIHWPIIEVVLLNEKIY